MLIAVLDGCQTEASSANKGQTYTCPKCNEVVVLKKGRIVVDHFAHKPSANCVYAAGETHEHMSGKLAIRDSFRSRGIDAEIERPVLSVDGDRRADILISSPTSKQRFIAIELQHQPIDLDQIEHRTLAYIAAGVPVLWIPILRKGFLDEAIMGEGDDDGDSYIKRYATPPWLRWLAEYVGERSLWFYDAENRCFWRGQLSPCQIYVPPSDWYDADGNEQSSGGYWKQSRRWMRLDLWGAYALTDVRLLSWYRPPGRSRDYKFPQGRIGALVLAKEIATRSTSTTGIPTETQPCEKES